MLGNKEQILSNVRKYPVTQIENKSKNLVITFRMKNGLAFATKYRGYELPLKMYMNLDEMKAILKTEEIISYCEKAITEGGWKFKFFKENI